MGPVDPDSDPQHCFSGISAKVAFSVIRVLLESVHSEILLTYSVSSLKAAFLNQKLFELIIRNCIWNAGSDPGLPDYAQKIGEKKTKLSASWSSSVI